MARKKAVKRKKRATRKGKATAKLRGFGKAQKKRAAGGRPTPGRKP